MKRRSIFLRCVCILFVVVFLFNSAPAEILPQEPISTSALSIETENNEYEAEPTDAPAPSGDTPAPETQAPVAEPSPTPEASQEATPSPTPENTPDERPEATPETTPSETQTAAPEETPTVADENRPNCLDGVYQISTADELAWFASLVNGTLTAVEQDTQACAVLENDIDLSGWSWTPIGSPVVPYAGSFDGAGHSVAGLAINSSASYQALFGYLTGSAKVCGLSVYGSVETSGDYAAGIVAFSEASLSDLHNYCSVTSAGRYVGGVLGAVSGSSVKLRGCTNAGNVSSTGETGMVGGVLGGGNGGVYDCANSGAVSGYAYVGGVAGNAGAVENCSNTATVSGVHQYIGGVAGSAASVDNCKNAGAVYLSGLFVASRDRYEGGYVGGVTGNTGSARGCENRGEVKTNALSSIFVSSAAGVAGRCVGTTSNCWNYGNVHMNGAYIAGVVGGNGGGSVVECVNHGDVINNAESGEQTGGVASAGKIERSVNYGSVRGYQSVGGVCGGTSNSTLRYCYDLGAVSGRNKTGGVAGVCLSAEWCYSAGTVSCRGDVAGMLAGSVSRAENCFYIEAGSVYSRSGTALDATALRLCMRGAEAYRINFDLNCQSGYPLLDFQQGGETVTADAVRLLPGVSGRYNVRIGGELRGLPNRVQVSAGGLEVECAVEWTCPDFNADQPGEYAFEPRISLPGCKAGSDACRIIVRVCTEEELPVITAWRLADDTPTAYTADYGCMPEDFPTGAWATVDGTEQYIPIEWIAPENLDLADVETEFIFEARPTGALRVGNEAQPLRASLRILPLMLISSLRFTDKNNADAAAYALHYLGCETDEQGETFHYTLDIFDSTGALYLWTELNAAYQDTAAVKYSYKKLDATGAEKAGSLRAGKSLNLSGLANRSPSFASENTLVLEASADSDAAQLKQRYEIRTRLLPTLASMKVLSSDTEAYLIPKFDGQWMDYSAQIPTSEQAAELVVSATLENVQLAINGEPVQRDADGSYRHTVDMSADLAEVEITLSRTADGETVESRYALHLGHQQETALEVHCTPENALFYIENEIAGRVFAGSDGVYRLIRGYDYSYTVTSEGYIAQVGELIADQAEMVLEIELQRADENGDIRQDIESDWNDFRGSKDNNGVTNAPAPISASDAVLYWANQAGVSYSSDAVSSPILVDGYLVCTAKQNIFKIDTITGEVVQVGDMVKKSAFNITPPTYAAGMIFVALADGYVQAFNADTLKSLWVYADALGGQPNSPISYRKGYIYTGFWNGEANNGNWVCISVTDEDPSRETEQKRATWVYTQKGGFYWAGTCVRDNFLLVGTDDGEVGSTSQSSNLLSLEPGTGRLIDCLSGLDADVRCSICYDKKTNRYYFTSKGGYFYSVAVSSDGYFDHSSLKKLDLRGGRTSEGKDVEGMSTSTPVVYNGRAYVGVSGVGQFVAYGGHCIAVIDLASWSIAYTCPTKGYPQTSGLLTNAYENTGLVYIYFFENMSPGTLRIIRDCPGQTQMLSIYDGSPIDRAEAIFTPRGAQRQYALCSPIIDKYGTIYFKNDSGHMMALGSMISGIEITDTPIKLLYEEGEVFSAEGMQVVAHMANGLTRDVSSYVSYSQVPLKAEDTDITIYFRHVRYNNDAEIVDPPQTALNITVLSHADMAALRETVEAIDALDEISIDSGDAIRAAREKYDALSVALQELVRNYERLTSAEEEYALLDRQEQQKIDRAERLIAAIGAVTLDSGATIGEAFSIYNSLSDHGRAKVVSYPLLLEKQAEYEALVAALDSMAARVMRMISELGEVDIDSGAKIYAARDAYDALNDGAKARVSNLAVLEAAEAHYRALIEASGEAARRVSDLIEAIGEVTLERERAILRAREAYDALDADSAARVDNYETLLAAEERLAELKRQRAELDEIAAELNGYLEQIRVTAPTAEAVNAENIGAIAPLVQAIYERLNALDADKRALLGDYAAAADSYRATIARVGHADEALGVSADGLEWYQQLHISACVGGDEDYQRFAAAVTPLRVLKLYRTQVIDLLTGEAAANHASIQLDWTIPVPRYNASAYDKIGVAQLGESGAVRNLDSEMRGSSGIRFAAQGDGLIGVVGTKAQIKTVDSEKGSISVLNELDKWRKDNAANAGGSAGNTLRDLSAAQSGAISYYGEAIASGQWQYQVNVIYPALLAELSDAQVAAYAAMSEAVEKGENSFFGQLIDPDEFDAVEACYRLSNPLAALVTAFDYRSADGVVDVVYALPEEEHIRAIDEWHAQIERIVNYCLIQGDAEITAARLYQYLTSSVQAQMLDAGSGDDLYAVFYPGALYALMQNCVAANDAANAYAYLLMQAGIECLPVREVLFEEAAASEEAAAQLRHQWLIVWINGAYYHADPELDVANAAASNAERDTLGHFGMSDERCRYELQIQHPLEIVVPECMRSGDSAPQNEAGDEAFAVPECPTGLTGYGMQQTVTTDGEKED